MLTKQGFRTHWRLADTGKAVNLQYYAAPPEVFDKFDAMLHSARQAIATAL